MDPTLIETPYFIIYNLWLFVSAAIILTIVIIIRLGIKNRLKLQFLSDNSWKIILVSIIGARALSIALNYRTYFSSLDLQSLLQVFYIWDKGLNFYGALIVFFLYLYFACKKRDEQNFWKWVDVIVPAVIAGLALGHMGAFFEGINYGKETSLPWGVNFESPLIKYTVPIHPTQIYAFLYSILTASIFITLGQNDKYQDSENHGLVGLGALSLYSLFRFLEGFIRGDDILMIGIFRVPQILALVVMISSSLILYFRYNKYKNNL